MLAQHRNVTVLELKQAAAAELEAQLQQGRAALHQDRALFSETSEIADVQGQRRADFEKVDLAFAVALAETPAHAVASCDLVERDDVEQMGLAGDAAQYLISLHFSDPLRRSRSGPAALLSSGVGTQRPIGAPGRRA